MGKQNYPHVERIPPKGQVILTLIYQKCVVFLFIHQGSRRSSCKRWHFVIQDRRQNGLQPSLFFPRRQLHIRDLSNGLHNSSVLIAERFRDLANIPAPTMKMREGQSATAPPSLARPHHQIAQVMPKRHIEGDNQHIFALINQLGRLCS